MLTKDELKQLADDPNTTEEDLNLLSAEELQQLNTFADSPLDKAASTMGSFAERAMQAVGKVPAFVSQIPIMAAGAAKLSEVALRHPQETITGIASIPLAAKTGGMAAAGAGVEAYKQIGQHIGRSKEAPKTSKEAALKIAKEAAIAGGLEGIGKLGWKVGKIAFAPKVEKVREMLDVAEAGAATAKGGKVLPKPVKVIDPTQEDKFLNLIKRTLKRKESLSNQNIRNKMSQLESVIQTSPVDVNKKLAIKYNKELKDIINTNIKERGALKETFKDALKKEKIKEALGKTLGTTAKRAAQIIAGGGLLGAAAKGGADLYKYLKD